ncbi:ADP-ribosylglycohydrolase family protein [Nocardia abscessus]|uniref:ADP-ribosylglycohydrolase family protein n=2 Tax=Nocardia abscessus TaxID=120957 RepID=UPI00031DA12E|nr:ADP-ribosylglycohydrolase family protein [Nocardia abscessus]MCC3332932.1 ADP-ribosylglycohydrolase family protein [Nocardia abscessus]
MTAAGTQKVAGMLLGGAVGDALGWPQENRSHIVGGNASRAVNPSPEFRSWSRYAGTQFGRYVDPVAAGEYSDDTQLLLAVAHACLRGHDWLNWLTRVELPQWIEYQRGGGGAVLRASRAWAEGRAPWQVVTQKDEPQVLKYYEAGANGAAMRIAPHVVVTARSGLEELYKRVILDSLSTHGHPRAVIGAIVHALALRKALLQQGTLEYGALLESVLEEESWQDPIILFEHVPTEWVDSYIRATHSLGSQDPEVEWKRVVEETRAKIRIALRGLSQGAIANDQQILSEIGCFGPEGGAGTVAAVAALYVAARTATRPMSGLLRTAFLENADTDTIASMTTSLLGALHGPGWLNGLAHTVQDRDHIMYIAEILTQKDLRNFRVSNSSSISIYSKQTKAWAKRLFDTVSAYAIPDGRRFEVVGAHRLRTKTSNYVARVIIRTVDGQTMFIDRVSKTQTKAWQEADQAENLAVDDSGRELASQLQLKEDVSRPPNGTVVSIELPVNSLTEVFEFYNDILGLPCYIEGDRMQVGEFLHFVAHGRTSRSLSQEGIIITLMVPDLERLSVRVRSSPGLQSNRTHDRDSLWVVDPNNNRVRLTQMRPSG